MKILLKYYLLFIFCIGLFSLGHGQQKTDSIAFKQVDEYLKINKKAKALHIALVQLDSATVKEDKSLQIKWNSRIGKIFRRTNFKKSLHYYYAAKQLSMQINDSLLMSNTYFDLGSVYLLKFSNETYKAQDINVCLDKKDSALVYFKSILKNFKHIKGAEGVVAKTYANLTGLYSYTGKQKEVETLAQKAIAYFEKQKDTIGIVGVKSNLGISQLYQGQLKKAAQNYLSALRYLKDTSNLKILNLKSINFDNLSQVYEAQNKHKLSRDYLYKSQRLRIIYLEKNREKELYEIESKFNLEVAVAKEASKTLQEKAEKEKLESSLIVASLLGVLAVLFAVFLYRNNKIKTIKKELLHQQNIQLLQQKNQSKVISATLDGRLEERQQISQVLHDSVSALLSSANMHLQVVKRKCNSDVVEIAKTQQILDEALNKVRNLSQQLVPAVLIKFGLISAIDDLCEKHSNADLLFRLDCDDETTIFDPQLELKIYNIIEECVNNIIKHSKADQAIISLEVINNQLEIEVFDNGVGFDSTVAPRKNGMGLHQVKARVAVLDGKLTITSKPNHFTKIAMQIPL